VPIQHCQLTLSTETTEIARDVASDAIQALPFYDVHNSYRSVPRSKTDIIRGFACHFNAALSGLQANGRVNTSRHTGCYDQQPKEIYEHTMHIQVTARESLKWVYFSILCPRLGTNGMVWALAAHAIRRSRNCIPNLSSQRLQVNSSRCSLHTSLWSLRTGQWGDERSDPTCGRRLAGKNEERKSEKLPRSEHTNKLDSYQCDSQHEDSSLEGMVETVKTRYGRV
jgi:hypothetical protein